MGSHACCWLSVVNDGMSNGGMLRVEKELGLREALQKFRDPEGDSEK